MRAAARATSRAASPQMRCDSHSPARPVFYSRSSIQTLQAPVHMTTSTKDYIHHHVAFLLQQRRDISQRHTVERRSVGCYLIDGTEVTLEWQSGMLVVVDGPLRQPFLDYLMQSEANAEYDTDSIVKTSALHHVPKERRMTFDDTHKQYSRLEAMRVAKEQASIREKAADYVRDGKQVPDELVRKYNKALRSKLRTGRVSNSDASPERPAQPEEASVPRVNSNARKEASSKNMSLVPPVVAAMSATQPGSSGQSITAPAAMTEKFGPTMALITHRGISLNGLPSYSPPPMMPSIITRSWSGTAIQPNSMMQVSHMAQPATIIMATAAAQGAATGSSAVPSVSAIPVVSAVPVLQGQSTSVKQGATTTTTTITYGATGAVSYINGASTPLSARGAQVSWTPMVQLQGHSYAGTSTQAWPMSPAPPSRPVTSMRPTLKSL